MWGGIAAQGREEESRRERGEKCDSAMFALDFLISPGPGTGVISPSSHARARMKKREGTIRAGCRTIFIESVSDPYERAYTPRPTYCAYRSISTLITSPLPADLNIYRLKRLLRGRL